MKKYGTEMFTVKTQGTYNTSIQNHCKTNGKIGGTELLTVKHKENATIRSKTIVKPMEKLVVLSCLL